MNKIIESYLHIYAEKCYTIKFDIMSFLNKNADINSLYIEIKPYFISLSREFNYIKNFDIGWVPTKNIIPEPWFYDPKYYSEKAIEISQNKQKKYIWINEGRWESEYYESSEEIAQYLSNWTCFDFPKNVKSMLNLIKEGYWLLKQDLPILSERPMIDTVEVFSWDDKFVLTGKSVDNVAMITIEQWERIVQNERCY